MENTKTTTLADIAAHVGARENAAGYVEFGSWQALGAFYFHAVAAIASKPVDMILHCPACHLQHVDEATPEWSNPPHRSHLCHGCGHIWRPADVATNGVAAITTRGSADSQPVQQLNE